MQRSVKPACLAESTVFRKRRRLTNWAANADAPEKEIKQLSEAVTVAHANYLKLETDEANWLETFEKARLRLGNAIHQCREENSKLQKDYKLLYDASVKVCGPSARTRRTLSIKDVLEEFEESKVLQDARIKEYEKLAQDAMASNKASHVPVVSLSVEELNYEWDSNDSSWTTSSTATVPATSSQSADATAASDVKTETGTAASTETSANNSVTKYFASVEEALKNSLAAFGDIDPFFSSNEDPEDVSYLSEEMKKTRQQGVQTATDLLKLSTEQEWSDYINNLQQQQSLLTKRKRRGASAINIHSFAVPRTPRDVRLLISPLSQYEDRFLGTIYGGNTEKDGEMIIQPVPLPVTMPSSVIIEEDAVMRRCRLQGLAAKSDMKVKRLQALITEWKKISSDNKKSVAKANMIYQNVVRDEYLENQRMKRELIVFGIAPGVVEDEDILANAELLTGIDGNHVNNGAGVASTAGTNKSSQRNNNSKSNKKPNKSTGRLSNGNGSNGVSSMVTSSISNLASAVSSLIGIGHTS